MATSRKRAARSGAKTGSGVGARLRRERLRQQIGLRELARRVGVSPSLISQIETGKSEPSVSTLMAIVSELQLSLNEVVFADASPVPARPTPGRGRVAVERGPSPAATRLQRAADRRVIRLETGVTWERLTSGPDDQVDFLYVIYEVGGASTPADALMRHAGREYGYVISGRLRVTVAFDDYELGPGDSISFDSTSPHRLANVGDEPVCAIWTTVGRGAGVELESPSP